MSNVLFDFGIFKIYWYSFLIVIGVVIGIYLAFKESKRNLLGGTYITDLCYYIVPVSIIGARLYYVIFNFTQYQTNLLSILYIWEGGLAIYGSVIAGIIYIIYYAKKQEKSALKTLDVLSASLILGQTLGRWGNFFNQECFGPETTRTFLESIHIPDFIINRMYINGTYYQPTFFYESLWCIIGFILILLIRYLWKNKKEGSQIFFYFIWYGIGRFIIEGLRTDSLYFGTIKISQVVSIILIIIGIIGFLTSKKRRNYIETNKIV